MGGQGESEDLIRGDLACDLIKIGEFFGIGICLVVNDEHLRGLEVLGVCLGDE